MELIPNLFAGYAHSKQSLNFQNLFEGEFCATMLFSSWARSNMDMIASFIATCGMATFFAVIRIVLTSPLVEMIRSNARRIVAGMQSHEGGIYLSKDNKKGNSMSAKMALFAFFGIAKFAIPVLVTALSPEPAFARLVDVAPKSNYIFFRDWRRIGISHLDLLFRSVIRVGRELALLTGPFLITHPQRGVQ